MNARRFCPAWRGPFHFGCGEVQRSGPKYAPTTFTRREVRGFLSMFSKDPMASRSVHTFLSRISMTGKYIMIGAWKKLKKNENWLPKERNSKLREIDRDIWSQKDAKAVKCYWLHHHLKENGTAYDIIGVLACYISGSTKLLFLQFCYTAFQDLKYISNQEHFTNICFFVIQYT